MQAHWKDPEPIQVLKAWWAVVGPALARAVTPVGYRNGRLELAVPDPAWLREMESRQLELIEKLRGRGLRGLQAIDCIHHPFRQEVTERPPSAPQGGAPELPADILWAAQAVSDPDLAERWTKMVARILALSSAQRIER